MSERPVFTGDHCVLIDGSALVYRAFHSNTKDLKRKSDGAPTGAVFGVVQSLWYLMTKASRPHTHVAIIFDVPGRTHRDDMADDYKANRAERPSELTGQRALINEAIDAFGISHVRLAGWEADDLIASYTRRATNAGAEVTIRANDKDLMALVRPGVVVATPGPDGVTFDTDAVVAKWGVRPDQLADLLALTGDVADNIRGVPGIGPTTAATLIARYGTLEEVLANASRDRLAGVGDQRRRNLATYADQARRAKAMILLREDVPLPAPIESFGVDFNPSRVLAFCRAVEFDGFALRVSEYGDVSRVQGSRST